MRGRRIAIGLGLALALSGGSILGHDLYLGAKAVLARALIRQEFFGPCQFMGLTK